MNKAKIIDMIRKDHYAEALDVIMEILDNTKRVTGPKDTLERLKKYSTKTQEYFLVVTLNGSHEIINVHEATKGLANRTLIHPREVFRTAIEDNSVAIIIAHNHPSGNPEPSTEDIELTKRIKDAGEIIGINVLDHIIISRRDYYSFKEHSIL